MKEIDINNVSKNTNYVTKGMETAKFVSKIDKDNLMFVVGDKVLLTNAVGKCKEVNGKPEDYYETSYRIFDVFEEELLTKFANLYKTVDEFGSVEYTLDSQIFSSFREAVNSAKSGYFKTVELNWSVV